MDEILTATTALLVLLGCQVKADLNPYTTPVLAQINGYGCYCNFQNNQLTRHHDLGIDVGSEPKDFYDEQCKNLLDQSGLFVNGIQITSSNAFCENQDYKYQITPGDVHVAWIGILKKLKNKIFFLLFRCSRKNSRPPLLVEGSLVQGSIASTKFGEAAIRSQCITKNHDQPQCTIEMCIRENLFLLEIFTGFFNMDNAVYTDINLNHVISGFDVAAECKTGVNKENADPCYDHGCSHSCFLVENVVGDVGPECACPSGYHLYGSEKLQCTPICDNYG